MAGNTRFVRLLVPPLARSLVRLFDRSSKRPHVCGTSERKAGRAHRTERQKEEHRPIEISLSPKGCVYFFHNVSQQHKSTRSPGDRRVHNPTSSSSSCSSLFSTSLSCISLSSLRSFVLPRVSNSSVTAQFSKLRSRSSLPSHSQTT